MSDGKASAGHEATIQKHNLQVSPTDPHLADLRNLVIEGLRRSTRFVSSALPLHVVPPLFSRYEKGMAYGNHIDNAMRFLGATAVRADLSATLASIGRKSKIGRRERQDVG